MAILKISRWRRSGLVTAMAGAMALLSCSDQDGSDLGASEDALRDASHTADVTAAEASSACPTSDVEMEGDVTARTTAELDALQGVTVIRGDLVIQGTAARDLEALACLRRVEGNLTIIDNESLSSLDGLGALTHVGGDLRIENNAQLTGAEALAERLEVAGSRIVEGAASRENTGAETKSGSPVLQAQTNVQPGTLIQTPVTWTLAGSPYYVGNDALGNPGPAGDLTIGVGGTLTIEAGVEVRFVSGDADREIVVDGGALVVQGIAGAPVVFQHNTDTAPGSWQGLRFTAIGTGSIAHAVIRHADVGMSFASPPAGSVILADVLIDNYSNAGVLASGTGELALSRFTIDGSAAAGTRGIGSSARLLADTVTITGVERGIEISGASSSVTNSTLTGVATTTDRGVVLTGTGLTLTGNVFRDFDVGFYVQSSVASFSRNVFWGTQTRGVQLATSSAFTATHNTFYGQSAAGIDAGSLSVSLTLTRNVFGTNGSAVIGPFASYTNVSENLWSGSSSLSGTNNLRCNALFKDPANGDFTPTERSPARWWDPLVPTAAAGAIAYAGDPTPGLHGAWYTNLTFDLNSVNDLTGDMLIHPTATVTFNPGATLRMTKGDVMQCGTDPDLIEIYAAGELAADGTVSNYVTMTSAEAAPAPGDWTGIVILQSTPSFNVSETNIRYAKNGIDLRTSSHIIQNTTIEQASNAGILITSGAPTINGMTLNSNNYGIISSGAPLNLNGIAITGSTFDGINATSIGTSTLTNVSSSGNGGDGLDLGSGTSVAYTGGTIADNIGDGMKITPTSTLADLVIARNGGHGVLGMNQTHTHNTIVDNGSYGINAPCCSARSVSLESTSITHNGSTGLGFYMSLTTCNASNIWGNPTPIPESTAFNTCFGYNPLYADLAGGDYRPTSRSPNRNQGLNGYIGALPYAGQLTVPMMGFFWEDHTFNTGSHTIPGDIIVPAGRTVAVQPGTVLLFKPLADDMGGGELADRAALRVLDQGTLFIDGSGAPIKMTSDTTTPAPGDWQGLYLYNAGGSPITNTILEYPRWGIGVRGPSAPLIERVEINYHAQLGITFDDTVNDATFDIDVNRVQIIGPGPGPLSTPMGINIQGSSSTGVIRNTYMTHHVSGYGLNVTGSSTNLDIINNTAVTQDIGFRQTATSGTFDVYNNIFSNNTSAAVSNSSSSSSTLVDAYRNNMFFGGTAISFPTWVNLNTGNISGSDPLIEDDDWQQIAPPRWWDGAVWMESLAVDGGYAAAPNLPTTDIRGNTRPLGAAPDIGAFEFDISSNMEPRADPVPATVLVPHNEPVTLDGSLAYDPDGTIVTAFWTIEAPTSPIDPGQVVAGLSPQYTFPIAGPNQYAFLTIIDEDGAEDHRRVNFDVDMRPVADAGVEVAEDTGVPVNFNEASTDGDGTIVSWSWDFGDGSPLSTTQNPSHIYSSPGTYTVTLTVTDNKGLTDVDTTLSHITGGVDTVGPNVQHIEITDGQLAGAPVAIVATITDPSGIDSAFLVYRAIGSASSSFIAMTNTGGSTYSATIPGAAVTTAGVEYWITASDIPGNPSTTPAGAPGGGVWNFLVVAETNPPVIVHTEIADGRTAGAPVTIQATISDATGVGEAYAYYRPLGSAVAFSVLGLVEGASNVWSAQIPGADVDSPGIEYYLTASDDNSVPNQAWDPVGAPTLLYNFTVVGGSGSDVTPPTITHTPILDGQIAGQPVGITADIIDGGGVTAASLFYRTTGGGAFTQAPMVNISGNTWQAQIPGAAVTAAGVDYYLSATDSSNNVGVDPIGSPANYHSFTVVASDTAGPVIVHTPIANGQTPNTDVVVQATVTDAAGIAFVRLRYRTQGGVPTYAQVNMVNTTGDTWEGTIPAVAVQSPGVDYYLQASDGLGNLSVHPATAPGTPHSFTVGATDTIGPTIVHTPIADGQLEGGNVLVTASVTDTSGIANVQLSYRVAGQPTFTTIPMVNSGGSTYEATIPGASVTPVGVDYFIVATDAAPAANVSSDPAAAWHSFSVAQVDTTGPAISHAGVPSVPFGADLVITANIADGSGVASASVTWWLDAGSPTTTAMVNITGTTYSATIPAASITNGTVVVHYYITATDTVANSSTDPALSPVLNYTVTVVYPDTTPPVVTLDPVTQPHPAGTQLAVTINATDTQSAITSVTLYYRQTGSGPFASAAATGAGPYSAVIPGVAMVTPSMEIYAEARDASGNIGSSATMTVNVSPPPDTTPPSVTVSPVPNGQVQGVDVQVLATISDASGISGATLYYRAIGGGAFTAVSMTNTGGSTYSGTIPGAAVVLAGVEYYVSATDGASNVAESPAGGAAAPLSFTVQAADGAGPTIAHSPPAGPLVAGSTLVVSADLVDPSTVAGGTLYWRNQGEVSWQALTLTNTGGSTWQATIPAVAAPGVEYYFLASDSFGNTSTSPAGAPGTWFTVAVVVPDTTAPVISHVPIANGQTEGVSVDLQATVTDATGVATVTAYYRTAGSGAAYSAVALTPLGGDLWSATLSGAAIVVPGVEYYIEAVDTSPAANLGRNPAGAPATPHTFTVVGVVVNQPPTIAHVPITTAVAGADVVVTATVSDVDGVASVRLYYRTPGAGTFTVIDMIDTAGTYSATIPGAAVTVAGVEYYVEATDASGAALVATSPAGAPGTVTSFPVTPPVGGTPLIQHTPIADGQPEGVAVTITATITDTDGIAGAILAYRATGDSSWTTVPLDNGGAASTYTASIPASAVTTAGVEYYIQATDTIGFVASEPAGAPGTFRAFTVVSGGGGTGGADGAAGSAGAGGTAGTDAGATPGDAGGAAGDSAAPASGGSEGDAGGAGGGEGDAGGVGGGEADAGGEGGRASSSKDDGGCGCRVGASQSGSGAFALLFGIVVAVLRRRRAVARLRRAPREGEQSSPRLARFRAKRGARSANNLVA